MTADEILKFKEPFELFQIWWDEVQSLKSLRHPTAVTLATATRTGHPSLRMLLLKGFDPDFGFVFFTNYESRKARELTENPHAALLFYWDPLFRQVKVEGEVEKVSREESVAYWNSRPWESRLAGFVSRQSAVLGAGLKLKKLLDQARIKWQGKDIPCPENWGGYRLKPQAMEFWVGHTFRLHDRVRFERQGSIWQAEQLYP